jgi:hypothetical protein
MYLEIGLRFMMTLPEEFLRLLLFISKTVTIKSAFQNTKTSTCTICQKKENIWTREG